MEGRFSNEFTGKYTQACVQHDVSYKRKNSDKALVRYQVTIGVESSVTFAKQPPRSLALRRLDPTEVLDSLRAPNLHHLRPGTCRRTHLTHLGLMASPAEPKHSQQAAATAAGACRRFGRHAAFAEDIARIIVVPHDRLGLWGRKTQVRSRHGGRCAAREVRRHGRSVVGLMLRTRCRSRRALRRPCKRRGHDEPLGDVPWCRRSLAGIRARGRRRASTCAWGAHIRIRAARAQISQPLRGRLVSCRARGVVSTCMA